MTPTPSTSSVTLEFPDLGNITRAAQWLADRQRAVGAVNPFAPLLPTLKARFGLADSDAAEAILLAGNFGLVRRAFG